MIVNFIEGFDKDSTTTFLKNVSPDIKIEWRNSNNVVITTGSEKLKEDLINKLQSRDDVYTCQPFYTLENGLDMAITDQIVVKFLPGVNKERQNALHEEYRTKVIDSYEIFQIIRVPKGGDALEIANKYYESGLVKFSTPDFFSNFEPSQDLPNDTYFNYQITCNNTGQTINDGHTGTQDADIDAPEAWERTTGSNDIVIAVIDEGVTSNHYDLPNTRQDRLTGSDFVDGDEDNDPSPTGNNNHGNACAGVIGATMNNNQGIAGIAPNCRIMPIRIDYLTSQVSDFALAIRFAANNSADIISNSWGLRKKGIPPYSPNLFPQVVSAIQHAVNNNCVVIFSVGNTARHTIDDNGYISFPANVTIPGVISVGASDRYDHQSDYSPTSDPESGKNQIIDIVAPSHRAYPPEAYYPLPGGISGETLEMWSIDIPGNTGYNPWPEEQFHPPSTGEQLPNSGTDYLYYTGRFGGTSHSCPVVAGIAALVLSIDQSLTYLEVFDILTSTADEVGGYTYTNGWSEELGYGRVNAFSAVCEALNRKMSVTGPSLVCTSNSTFTLHDRPPSDTVSWTKGPYLSYVSGQYTDNYTVKASSSSVWGSSWVKATITSDCGTVIFDKFIWVGCTEIGDLVFTNDLGEEDFLCSDWEGNLVEFSSSTSCNYFDIWLLNEYGTQVLYKLKTYTTEGSLDFSWISPGYYLVQVRGINDCGTGQWNGSEVEYVDCWDMEEEGNMYYLKFVPNPAYNSVEISVFEDENLTTLKTNNEFYQMQIYNTMKVLKYQVITKEPILRINTANFENGLYFVHFIFGKETQVLQLVISH